MDFKGIKHKDARNYDRVSVYQWDGMVCMIAYDGIMKKREGALVAPATARKIAAELVKLADEAEGVKP